MVLDFSSCVADVNPYGLADVGVVGARPVPPTSNPRPDRHQVVIASGSHLFPFRTEKLSPPAPMVLQCNAGE